MIYPKEYCIFDFETTGLDPTKDKVIEIGAYKVEYVAGSEVTVQRSWLIKQDKPLPPIITQITGINDEMLNSFGMDEATAFYEFIEFANVNKLPLIGHNIIKFDLLFLSKILLGGTMIEIKKKCIDTAALFKARKLHADRYWHESLYEFSERVIDTRVPGLKFNVGVACDELGIDKTKAIQHRAEGDVILTNEIYKELCLKKNVTTVVAPSASSPSAGGVYAK